MNADPSGAIERNRGAARGPAPRQQYGSDAIAGGRQRRAQGRCLRSLPHLRPGQYMNGQENFAAVPSDGRVRVPNDGRTITRVNGAGDSTSARASLGLFAGSSRPRSDQPRRPDPTDMFHVG